MRFQATVLVLMVVSACGASDPRRAKSMAGAPSVPKDVAHQVDALEAAARARVAMQRSAAAAVDLTYARAHQFATLSQKTLGPFISFSEAGGLAVWIAPSDRNEGLQLVAAPLAEDGAPVGQVRVAARVPRDTNALVVKPAGPPSFGWLVAWTSLLDRGEAVTVLGLARDGSPRGEPIDVQRTSDHVPWLELVPVSGGGLCLWAEQTSAGDANILTVPIGEDGKARGLPMRVADGVRRWQAVPTGDGAALALVEHVSGQGAGTSQGVGERRRADSLIWLRLDSDGRPARAPLIVARGSTVGSDLEVASWGSEWLLAWTDHRGQDARVVFAEVKADGRARGPWPALDAADSSSLVAFAGGPKSAALVWQEARHRLGEGRTLRLGLVASSTSAERPLIVLPTGSLDIAAASLPELVTAGDGFALLATARACQAGAASPCTAPWAPAFVRLDPKLHPVQTEPLAVGDAHAFTAMGWGLTCFADQQCVALAATGQTPTPVFAMDLRPRRSPFRAPAANVPPPDAPQVGAVMTLGSGEPYDEVAAGAIGSTHVLLTLARSLPTGDFARAGSSTPTHSRNGGEAPRRRRSRAQRLSGNVADQARLGLRVTDAAGRWGPPLTLTSRALATGGLAVAPGPQPRDGVGLAWVATMDGATRVHLALIDSRGHLSGETRLAAAGTSAREVALAWAGGGWLVVWVDARTGNGEVYATRVDAELHATGREQRLTQSAGDASDLSVAVDGDAAWVAFSDSRDSPGEGIGDIYCEAVHPLDGTGAGQEVRVLATARHSRSPELVATGQGDVLLAWIEDAPPGLEGPSAAMVARLDVAARVVQAPHPLALAGEGRPTSLALARQPKGEIRAVIARAASGGITIDGLRLHEDGSAAGPSYPLLDLDAPDDFQIGLAVDGDALFFDDVGNGPTDRRVRRADIQWSR